MQVGSEKFCRQDLISHREGAFTRSRFTESPSYRALKRVVSRRPWRDPH